jgi:hypothetical protein
VAQQAGHSPTMALSTYAHLFDEHDRDENRSAERRSGRRKVSAKCPFCVRPKPTNNHNTREIPAKP